MSKGLDDLFEDLPTRLGIDQVVEIFGVDRQVIYRWLRQGKIPGYKFSGTWVVLRDELKETMVRNHNQTPSTIEKAESQDG